MRLSCILWRWRQKVALKRRCTSTDYMCQTPEDIKAHVTAGITSNFTPYFTSCNTRAQEKRTCGIIVWHELPRHPQPANQFWFFLFPGLECTGTYCLTRTRQYISRRRASSKRITGGNIRVSIFVLSVITVHVSWCKSWRSDVPENTVNRYSPLGFFWHMK
jgi:hypothetical protein